MIWYPLLYDKARSCCMVKEEAMNNDELKNILEDNRKWLNGESGGKPATLQFTNLGDMDLEGADLECANLWCANLRSANLVCANLERANLWCANLRCANLRDANMRGADFRSADLREADFRGADFRCANLWCANLERANLVCANLLCANLWSANLRCANLRCANLWDANMRGADLRGADLREADFRGADFQGADLREADFRGADLRDADLGYAYTDGMKTDANTKIDWPMVCPETGSFIGWKKAGGRIVKLEIPEDAERSSATTKKCRASMARVLEIQNVDGTRANKTEVKSSRGKTYKVGEMIYPDDWDYNRWNECSHGIHFFMTRYEAVEW